MPTLTTELPETTESISRPITLAVMRDIFDRTGINIDTNITFNKPDGQALTIGSKLICNPEDVSFKSDDRLEIDVTEVYHDDEMLSTSVPWSEYPKVFADTALGIWIRPIYVDTEVSVNFTMRFDSENSARTWLDAIRRRVSASVEEYNHQADYHYPLPKAYLYILKQLHTLRENIAPYNESLDDYYNRCFTDRSTVLVNQAGKRPLMAISERQVGMLGYFSFDAVPEVTKGEYSNTYTSSFSYTFRYDKPITVAIHYPTMVHNQVVPCELRAPAENFQDIPLPVYGSVKKMHFMHFSQETSGDVGPTVVPYFDDWRPTYVPKFYTTLSRFMLQVDTQKPTYVANLTDLDDFVIHPTIIDYMIKEHRYLHLPGKCPIYVGIYRGQNVIDYHDVYIDQALNVFTKTPMDVRDIHHLWIGLLNDLVLLEPNDVDRLRKDGEVVKIIVTTLDPTLCERGLIPPLLSDGSMPKRDWYEIINDIISTNPKYQEPLEVNRAHVGNFTVTAHRTE